MKRAALTIALLISTIASKAHPSPNSVILLDVGPKTVTVEAQIPLPELALVLGEDIQDDPKALVTNYRSQLESYLLQHVHAFSDASNPWSVSIKNMHIDEGLYVDGNSSYRELVVEFNLTPNRSESTRRFSLHYDAVMHQVMNHVAMAFVRSDWEGGVIHQDSTKMAQVIGWDLAENSIHPLEVDLEEGSWWNGFAGMVNMGMHHIKEGTDHLLFLITLLLPATLVASSKRWENFGGIRYSTGRLIGIVTAFTIGHSLTLLIGAFKLLVLPEQPVEILIAFSILISAAHAIRPIFPGKEMFVAGGFGLIHGLAFSTILSGLHLNTTTLLWSVLGFNLGIELMQILIIMMIIPWLILLSQTSTYSTFRVTGSVVAAVAATGWIIERNSGAANMVTDFVSGISPFALWGIGPLAMFSIFAYWKSTRTAVGI